MQNIEKKVKEQDNFIKNQTKKLTEALEKTVSLEEIDEKMEYKLIRFFKKDFRKSYSPKNRRPTTSNLDDTYAIFSDIKYRGSEFHREEMKLDSKNDQSLDISAIDDRFNLQDRHDTFFIDPELLNDLKNDDVPLKRNSTI
jgi:hypothetical protein